MRVAISIRFICTGRLRTDRHRGNSRLESSYVGGSREASVLPRATLAIFHRLHCV
jgi:hypothetical protein